MGHSTTLNTISEKIWLKPKKSVKGQTGRKAVVGIVVLPLKSSVNIRGLVIPNLAKTELKIDVFINKKLRELTPT